MFYTRREKAFLVNEFIFTLQTKDKNNLELFMSNKKIFYKRGKGLL